jgi:hypothetical protein
LRGKREVYSGGAVPIILPTEERKRRLSNIQKYLAENKEEGTAGPLSKAVALMVTEPSFQKYIAASKTLSAGVKDAASLMEFAWAYLLHLLYARDHVAAALVLWDTEVFSAEPRCVQLIWNALLHHRMIVLIGGGGMSKTYSPSAFFLLEYVLDPQYTRVQVASASHDHLMGNLFRDIGALHSDASMVLPGKHDSQSISLDKKKRQGVFTLTLPQGSNGKSKIKGSHTKPRPQHPLFGRRSRLFCLIDESQEIPESAFDEIPNRFSTVDGSDVEHLKFSLSANPREIFSKFGQLVKPKGGWEIITREKTTWMSEKGWAVVSLDQTTHENYIARKVVFPGFATYEGVQARLRDCDGDADDPRMWTYAYGKFPPQGTTFAIIKQRHLLASEGEWIFSADVTALAGMDPAFTSDRPAFASGRAGMAVGWTDSAGERHMLPTPKMAVQIDQVVVLPRFKGQETDSQDLADEAMMRLKDTGVKPGGFGIDQTGVGRGTADIIRRQWDQKVGKFLDEKEGGSAGIWGIEYASSPTSVKIAEEDSLLPKDRFDRIATELWYAAAKFFEFDLIRIGNGVDVKVVGELAARKGDMQPGLGKKLTVETKDAYKKRTSGQSPDLADATLLLIHVARMSIAGISPRAKDTKVDPPPRQAIEWSDGPAFAALELAGFGPAALPDLLPD